MRPPVTSGFRYVPGDRRVMRTRTLVSGDDDGGQPGYRTSDI